MSSVLVWIPLWLINKHSKLLSKLILVKVATEFSSRAVLAASAKSTNRSGSLVHRPLPDFISQPWEWPGNEATLAFGVVELGEYVELN